MRRYTTEIAIKMIKEYESSFAHFEAAIKTKTTVPVENQTDWLRNITVERMRGRMEMARSMVDGVLMHERCYFGFQYVAKDFKTIIDTKHPEYDEDRVSFIIKEK